MCEYDSSNSQHKNCTQAASKFDCLFDALMGGSADIAHATLSRLNGNEETRDLSSTNYRSVQFCTDSGAPSPQKYIRGS
jgi:hypothetical protein